MTLYEKETMKSLFESIYIRNRIEPLIEKVLREAEEAVNRPNQDSLNQIDQESQENQQMEPSFKTKLGQVANWLVTAVARHCEQRLTSPDG